MNIIKKNKNYKINIKLKDQKKFFLISNNFQNSIYNILAALAVMSIYENIFNQLENSKTKQMSLAS